MHRCVPIPKTRDELAYLYLTSACVLPFFYLPGVVNGKCCVDGGFSAVYSVPDGQPWSEVTKVTCVPQCMSMCPPSMCTADIQPKRLLLKGMLLLSNQENLIELIKLGYDDTRQRHNLLISRGFRPVAEGCLTTWSEWEWLLRSVDFNNPPPLNTSFSTKVASVAEKRHATLLRTYSNSDLNDALQG